MVKRIVAAFGLALAGLVAMVPPTFAQDVVPMDEQRRLAQAVARLKEQARAPVVERPATVAAQPRSLMGFSIVLVQGDMKGTSATEGVPAPAAKALADLKDFLPYRSYQHLDTQWTMGSGRLVSRLQRPGQTYEVELVSLPVAHPTDGVNVSRFILREVSGQSAGAGDGGSPELTALRQRLHNAERQLAEARTKFESGLISRAAVETAEEALIFLKIQEQEQKQRIAEAMGPQPVVGPGPTIIDSSFRMSLGETVVVGTSRIAGDRALIVLLTAVGK